VKAAADQADGQDDEISVLLSMLIVALDRRRVM